jgi:hypothetical protein
MRIIDLPTWPRRKQTEGPQRMGERMRDRRDYYLRHI